MKYKYIFLFYLLISCVPSGNLNKSTHSSSGFAYIFNDEDYTLKLVSKSFDNSKLSISHDTFKVGTIIKITNPENNLSFTQKVTKKSKYPDFYQILITEAVANKIKLNSKKPFIEIQELKKNRSFIAEKAIIFNEEKKIFNKAPVTNVKIDNISKSKIKSKKVIFNKFSIVIANFYSKDSANILKDKLISELPDLNKKKFSIVKENHNSYTLILGPYKAINSLKNDYIKLKNHNFEQLEVKLDE